MMFLKSWPRFKKTVASSTYVLLLGFIRYFTNKSVDYQEHHSEYGMHWNFFFCIYL